MIRDIPMSEMVPPPVVPATPTPLAIWRAICEDAPATVMMGCKYLLLSEDACVQLGTALEIAEKEPGNG